MGCSSGAPMSSDHSELAPPGKLSPNGNWSPTDSSATLATLMKYEREWSLAFAGKRVALDVLRPIWRQRQFNSTLNESSIRKLGASLGIVAPSRVRAQEVQVSHNSMCSSDVCRGSFRVLVRSSRAICCPNWGKDHLYQISAIIVRANCPSTLAFNWAAIGGTSSGNNMRLFHSLARPTELASGRRDLCHTEHIFPAYSANTSSQPTLTCAHSELLWPVGCAKGGGI